MVRNGLRVALIGGGRWARVHASVLGALYPRVGRLIWVSHHNREALEQSDITAVTRPAVEIVDNLNEALTHRPDAAVICTASTSHARDALAVLERGLPALVEKPLALEMGSATALITLAERRGLALCVCLPLLMASYLRAFKTGLGRRLITFMRLRWFDPSVESRYGDVKYPDVTTHKVDEIVPHLWSLITALIGAEETEILSTALRGSDTVSLTLASGEIRVEANFGRHATARIRRIEISFADKGVAELDFACEPGLATIDGKRCRDDGNWESGPRPLTSVYMSFLDGLGDGAEAGRSSILASRCIGSVRLAHDVRRRVVSLEAERAAAFLRAGKRVGDDPELMRLMVDNLGPELARLGIRTAPSDEKAHRRLAEATQSEILRQAGILDSPSEMPAVNEYSAGLAASDFVGQLLVHLRRRWPCNNSGT
jgi:predicted dehydrogenase